MHRQQIENLLGALALSLTDSMSTAFRELGLLTSTDASTLILLLNSHAMSIGELAATLTLSHSSMVRVGDRLVRRALVTRVRGRDDARLVVLKLSTKGVSLAKRALLVRGSVLNSAVGSFTAEEIKQLGVLLSKGLHHRTGGHFDADRICRLCDESTCTKLSCPVEVNAVARDGVRSVRVY